MNPLIVFMQTKLPRVLLPLLLAGLGLAALLSGVGVETVGAQQAQTMVYNFIAGDPAYNDWGPAGARCWWGPNFWVGADDVWYCSPRSGNNNSILRLKNQDISKITSTWTITNVLSVDIYFDRYPHPDTTGQPLEGKGIYVSVSCRGQTYTSEEFIILETSYPRWLSFDINYGLSAPCPLTPTMPANTTWVDIHGRHNGSNANSAFQIEHVIIYGESGPPPPPPPPPPLDFPTYCTFTTITTISSTVGITDTQTITHTETITYTTPSNLLRNPSFESVAAGQPEHWQVMTGLFDPNLAGYLQTGSPRTGVYHISNMADYQLYQQLQLYHTGQYAVGFYAMCVSSTPETCNNQNASISLLNSSGPIAATSNLSSTYQVFSGTAGIYNLSGHMAIQMEIWSLLIGIDDLFVDDAFVFPVDGSGNLLCDAAYYPPPPDEGGDTTPGSGGLPVPIGGAGVICYNCAIPENADTSFIGLWFTWLACVIRNMFSCSLRVWFLNLQNNMMGIFNVLMAFFFWLPASVQSGANWYSSQVVPAISSYVTVIVTTTMEPGTNLWDFLIALLNAVASIVNSVATVLVTIISVLSSLIMVISNSVLNMFYLGLQLIDALQTALAANPYEIVIMTHDGQEINAIDPGQLAASGPNTTKVFWLFLAGMAIIDSMVNTFNLHIVLQVAVGIMGIITLLWTLNETRGFLQF